MQFEVFSPGKHGSLYKISNDSEKHTYSGIFCTAEDALRMYNFAPKNSEAYESKQIQGVALPHKEQPG